MTGTPPEDIMEWLIREEEILGAAGIERALADIESMKAMLARELGYEPTESQIERFWEAKGIFYEQLPEIGIVYRPEIWRGQVVYRYRDIVTMRYVSPSDVWALLGELY